MQKFLTATVLALASIGCVMPGDIADLKRAQAQYEVAVAKDLDDLERGLITRAEFDRRQDELRDEHAEEVAAVEEKVKERTEAALAAAAPTPITGNLLIDMVLGLGGTALAAGVGVNRYRDNKRRQRHEPVTVADVKLGA